MNVDSQPERARTSDHRRLAICLINPRSNPSYWTFDFGQQFFNLGRKKQYSMANGALVGVAALVPHEHEVVIVDENIESLDFQRLKQFDVIGVTGMIVQAERMLEILRKLRTLPATIVVGGPFVTVSEETFKSLSDVRFIGEAEETWPQFLKDLASGSPIKSRYEQAEKTDMTTVPVPRFDLLQPRRYTSAPVQFSRGCPFLCEFCDIITIFGRRPRVKRPEQVLVELESLVSYGFRECFLVDDNFIGNKLEAKRLLRKIIEWQESRNHPLTFSCEASINLADDAELIDLMVRARFRTVFIGIESPRKESLKETRKNQNVHGDSLLTKIDRIRKGGLFVVGGFIVGFDSDDMRIFDEQFDFIQASGIANLSISILTPLPTTPLYNRLREEGRLDLSDPEVAYLPKKMSRDQLKSGFRKLLKRLFDPHAYFARAFDGINASIESPGFSSSRRSDRWSNRLRITVAVIARTGKLIYVIARANEIRPHVRVLSYVSARNSALGKDALSLEALVNLWVVYWHFRSVTRLISGTQFGLVPSLNSTNFEPHRTDSLQPVNRVTV